MTNHSLFTSPFPPRSRNFIPPIRNRGGQVGGSPIHRQRYRKIVEQAEVTYPPGCGGSGTQLTNIQGVRLAYQGRSTQPPTSKPPLAARTRSTPPPRLRATASFSLRRAFDEPFFILKTRHDRFPQSSPGIPTILSRWIN